jgi:hypothetical protein
MAMGGLYRLEEDYQTAQRIFGKGPDRVRCKDVSKFFKARSISEPFGNACKPGPNPVTPP